jgi:hypothetical protein
LSEIARQRKSAGAVQTRITERLSRQNFPRLAAEICIGSVVMEEHIDTKDPKNNQSNHAYPDPRQARLIIFIVSVRHGGVPLIGSVLC